MKLSEALLLLDEKVKSLDEYWTETDTCDVSVWKGSLWQHLQDTKKFLFDNSYNRVQKFKQMLRDSDNDPEEFFDMFVKSIKRHEYIILLNSDKKFTMDYVRKNGRYHLCIKWTGVDKKTGDKNTPYFLTIPIKYASF